MSLANYSFLPWVRQGLANAVQAPAAGALRATANVKLAISGSGGDAPLERVVERDVELYGPGDVVGIDPSAIVKIEPRNWITDFEPNYLPYVDFYDEAFIWRYTPSPPAGDRLQPWLALVVLAEGEFERVAGRRLPLPVISVGDPDSTLPDPTEGWAWAHVHVDERVTAGSDVASTDAAAIAAALDQILARNPDLAHSRLLSPRKLTAKTAYTAFLVPAFETGRLAGLGLDPGGAPGALHAAWRHDYPVGTKPEPQHLPVYFEWRFETAETGDFEHLVRLLEPRIADPRVGRKNFDVTRPGSNIAGIANPELEGVLRIGGALQVPMDTLADEDLKVFERYEGWDTPYPHPFQSQLSELLNLRDAYVEKPAKEANEEASLLIEAEEIDDPIITPPIYGQWHARIQRVLNDRDGNPVPNRQNWVHELSLDPRHRATAAYGTQVIQQNQEHFMAAAWEQVGDVLAANRKLRLAQLALQTNRMWHGVHLAPKVIREPGRALQMMFPVARRVVAGSVTARTRVAASVVPLTLVNAVFRRLTRPRGRIFRRLRKVERIEPTSDLVTRVANGEVLPAPPKITPPVLPTPEGLKDDLEDAGSLPQPKPRLGRLGLVLLLLLLIGLALLALFPGWLLLLLVGLLIAVLAIYLGRRRRRKVPVGLDEEALTPESVADLPTSPDFRVSTPAEGFTPTIGGTADSAEGARYKTALTDLFTGYQQAKELAERPAPAPLDVPRFTREVHTALDPGITLPNRIWTTVRVPGRIADGMVETFAPVMAYPVFDTPMYEPLTKLSSEHFVPNLQLITQNSISLLETNQPFIEAYMVGLNHEFARELLWREYPTDQRGSCFRQFWDVSSYLDEAGKDVETLREELRDIPPIHRWPRASALGDHDHRERGGEAENELVLVIRGELLKRYPNAVIYAHRAVWQRDDDGNILKTKERRLEELSEAEQESPPPTKLQTPLYEAKVEPDVYFFGFDLTAVEARGDTGEEPDDDPGWFFVIKERPGEPRFGLDVESAGGSRAVWNDLAWPDVLAGGAVQFLDTDHTFNLTEPPADDERHEQWEDDRHVSWTPAANSGDLAYILYQVPVMVAVHASEMLPREEE